MMNLEQALATIPDTPTGVVVILSGGLDSSIATMLAVEKYGEEKVTALSFNYGQKQVKELDMAARLCAILNIPHKILDIRYFGDLVRPMSANIGGSAVTMPTIKDVLGDPQPKTYVPFRNMLLLTNALATAEVQGADTIFCGLQVHDTYGYWDTSQAFVDDLNKVAAHNRQTKINILAPFAHLSKKDEILLAREMAREYLLKYTLTCYNPDEHGHSCGTCPSCAERIKGFAEAGVPDPVQYSKEIPWDRLIAAYSEV